MRGSESLSAVIFELCSRRVWFREKMLKAVRSGGSSGLPPPPYPEQPHFDFFHILELQSGKTERKPEDCHKEHWIRT